MISPASAPAAATPDVPGHVEATTRWVACAAGLCAIHCIASPILATVAPFLALGETAEWFLLAATCGLALALISIGPRSGRLPVVGLVVSGGAVWAASLLGAFEPVPEIVTSPVGSLLIAGGMLWSARLCRRGVCRVDEGTERAGVDPHRLPGRVGARVPMRPPPEYDSTKPAGSVLR